MDKQNPQISHSVVTCDPEILGGTPVFTGTRVPVRILSEHLEAGDRLDDFLDNFPSVTRNQATQAIKLALDQFANQGDEITP